MKNIKERKKMVAAMEYIARQINDEDVLEGWVMCGVAEGDIPYGCFDVEMVDDSYVEDDNFRDLMGCFLSRMERAKKSGGLYCDNVLSKECINNE